MSKLTLHCQMVPGWVPDFLKKSGATWFKGIDNFPTWEGVETVGRTFIPDEETNTLIWHGAAGAETWFKRMLPTYKAHPGVHCWEAPNEPQPMWNLEFRRKLDEFTARLAYLMHNEGLLLVGHNFSVGWPDIGHGPHFARSMSVIDYLGLHEYAAPEMWHGDGYLTLRYRRLMKELRDADLRVPPILITECGIDGGVINRPKTGWKTFVDEPRYVEQLLWYESEIQKDPEVKTATIFTAGPYMDWMDFEVTEGLAMLLAERLAGGVQ